MDPGDEEKVSEKKLKMLTKISNFYIPKFGVREDALWSLVVAPTKYGTRGESALCFHHLYHTGAVTVKHITAVTYGFS